MSTLVSSLSLSWTLFEVTSEVPTDDSLSTDDSTEDSSASSTLDVLMLESS